MSRLSSGVARRRTAQQTIWQKIEGLRPGGSTPCGLPTETVLKVIGTDPLPRGVVFNAPAATVTVVSNPGWFDGWEMTGLQLIFDCSAKGVRRCNWDETALTGSGNYISGTPGKRIQRVTRCTFRGKGNGAGIAVAINGNPTNPALGFGNLVVVFEIELTDFCSFFDLRSDAQKLSGSTGRNGQRVEWCYIAPPRNLPATPTLYNSGTGYVTGHLIITAAGHHFIYMGTPGLVPSPTPPTSKIDNASWTNLDPHADVWTNVASIFRTSVRYCCVDWDNGVGLIGGPYGNQGGINNIFRVVRNDNKDYLFDEVLFEYIITKTDPTKNGFPLQVVNDGLGFFNGPIIFNRLRMQPRAGGEYFHSSTNAAGVDNWIDVRNLDTDALVAAPTGAATTDTTSAPVKLTNPAISGADQVGHTKTATVGTYSGFPTPFTEISWEETSDNGATYATITDEETETLLLAAAMQGKKVRAAIRYFNSTFELGTTFRTPWSGTIAAGYEPAVVYTNKSGKLTLTPGGTADCLEFSCWLHPISYGSPSAPRLVRASNGFDVYLGTGGQLNILVYDDSGVLVYSLTTANGVIKPEKQNHIYFAVDQGGAPNVRAIFTELKINGVTPSITVNRVHVAGTGRTRPNRSHEVMAVGTSIADFEFHDFWLAYRNTLVGSAAFWNSGVPPVLTGVGSPHAWPGPSVADFNARTNRGSSTLSGTGTFTA